MVLTAKSRYTYIPVFNGNRELPEKERVTIEIIRPKAEERDQLFSLDPEREYGLEDFEKQGVRKALTLRSRWRTGQILRVHVGEIKNFSVEENGKKHAVTCGTELAECTAFGIRSLIDELKAEVLSDRLTEDEKKSLPSPSNSSMKDGPENTGIPSTTINGNNSVSDSSSGENSKTT